MSAPPQEVRFAKSRRPQLQQEAQALVGALVRFKGELGRVVESSLSAGSDMTTVLCISWLAGQGKERGQAEWVPLPLVEVLEKAPPPTQTPASHPPARGFGGEVGMEISASLGRSHYPGWRNHIHMSETYWAAKGLVMLLGVGVVGLVLMWVGLAVVLAMISG